MAQVLSDYPVDRSTHKSLIPKGYLVLWRILFKTAHSLLCR